MLSKTDKKIEETYNIKKPKFTLLFNSNCQTLFDANRDWG